MRICDYGVTVECLRAKAMWDKNFAVPEEEEVVISITNEMYRDRDIVSVEKSQLIVNGSVVEGGCAEIDGMTVLPMKTRQILIRLVKDTQLTLKVGIFTFNFIA